LDKELRGNLHQKKEYNRKLESYIGNNPKMQKVESDANKWIDLKSYIPKKEES